MDRVENEEHLHLNGKFFLPSFFLLYLFCNGLVMCRSKQEPPASGGFSFEQKSPPLMDLTHVMSLFFAV